MRKRLISQTSKVRQSRQEGEWLDLEHIAEVEITSEDPNFPIESALSLEAEGQGWRAAEPGEQLVRIVFDAPVAVHRISLQFVETQTARTQEFVLRWAAKRNEPFREIVRQQWTFSPNGSTREIEDYAVNLADLGVLELAIKPDISGGNALASLVAWHIA
ncbi:MAG: carbohydrate-binding protein [Deltaproteobacteria bacterium]|nr:carbohydrate-binding protein [Deltaproteobacteria bacterium]